MNRRYHERAVEWLESRGLSSLISEHAYALAILLADVADGEEPEPKGDGSGFGSVVLARQREELTQRTIKILGASRSLETLKTVPHLRRAVAMHAEVEVGVLRDFLNGRPVTTKSASAIRRSLRDLGYETFENSKPEEAESSPRAADRELPKDKESSPHAANRELPKEKESSPRAADRELPKDKEEEEAHNG